MTKRTKTGQAKHDKGVLASVKHYKKQGYKINADLPDYNKPKKIKGFIPDVIAKKGNKEIILEIETKQSIKTDKKQLQAFDDYASQHKNSTFKTKVI